VRVGSARGVGGACKCGAEQLSWLLRRSHELRPIIEAHTVLERVLYFTAQSYAYTCIQKWFTLLPLGSVPIGVM
jgi:hypothetical protein